MNINMIINVCNIVDMNSNPQVAYNLAENYLYVAGLSLTSDIDRDTISLIKKYMKKGVHPSEGMNTIFKDDKVKNIANNIEKFVDNALKS